MSLLQVDLLERWLPGAADDAVFRALLASVPACARLRARAEG